MNEAESLQLFSSIMQGGYTALGIYLTVLSGYLAVAYLVGNKLSKFQVSTITFIFVCFSLVLVVGGWAFFTTGMTILLGLGDRGSVPVLKFLAAGVHLQAAVQLIAVGLAMKFMLNERRNVET